MNYKNLLQEFCQSNKIPLPIYESIPYGTDMWVSVVKVNGETYETIPKNSKKEAEKKAAKLAYTSLNVFAGPQSKNIIQWVFSNLEVYIDVENQPNATIELLKIVENSQGLPETIKIFLVINEKSHHFGKLMVNYGNLNGVTILSTCVDTQGSLNSLITIYIATNLNSTNCVIFSEDKFYDTLKNVTKEIEFYDCTLSVAKSLDVLLSMLLRK